jgi:hypothetical protein
VDAAANATLPVTGAGSGNAAQPSAGAADDAAELDAAIQEWNAQNPDRPIKVHRIPIYEVRLTRTLVSRETKDIGERVRYLRSIGVATADLADASRALDERRSDCCGCRQWKRPGESFCGDCWHILTARLHERLKRHISDGYLDAMRESWKLLEGRWQSVEAARRSTDTHAAAETTTENR